VQIERKLTATKKSKPGKRPEEKTPRDSAFLTRKIVGPDQLNPNGTLFGGTLMSWIDEVAFMSARRHSGRPFVVTASIDNISFQMPLRLGEHVILTSQVNFVGRSSMEIGVKVEREDPYSGNRTQATTAYLTFVALDKSGRPTEVPRLRLENEEDQRRSEEARLRVKVRERVRQYWKRKYALREQKDPPEQIAHRPTAKELMPRQLAEIVTTVRDVVEKVPFLKGKRSAG
jgi:acyl-CoA hydrolase